MVSSPLIFQMGALFAIHMIGGKCLCCLWGKKEEIVIILLKICTSFPEAAYP